MSNDEKSSIERILVEVVRGLVDKPDRVRVESRVYSEGVMLVLFVSGYDLPRFRENNERMTRSLRTIVAASCAKSGESYSLEITEG